MKRVFFDVDTQLDFLYPAGALAVPGADNIVKALNELTRFAGAKKIQIVSTADAHSEDDAEFKIWKPHCVVGTTGQQKAGGTLLPQPVILSSAPGSLDPIRSRVRDAAQIIVEKQKIDCFTNPNLRSLLEVLKADRYVVYGVLTEYCVNYAAFALLEMGAQVELVTDAIRGLDAAQERATIQRFQASGGRCTTVSDACR